MTNPYENLRHHPQSAWISRMSDDRVEELFRALKAWQEEHPGADGGTLRAMAMACAVSDLVDVMAFCFPPERLEEQIGIVVEHIRIGHPELSKKWAERMGRVGKHAEFPMSMVCPNCGAQHDVAGTINSDDRPSDGDVSLCVQCGEPAIFDFSLPGNMRKPTIEELEHIAADPDIERMKRAWRNAKALEEPSIPNPNTPWKLKGKPQ